MNQKNKYTFSLFVLGALFFVFGFVTWLNNILIPFFQTTCELTNFQSSFVPFAFYISYFVMSIPSSMLIKKTGFANGMILRLIIMAMGSIVFVPAAMNRSFTFFLVGLFVQGIGLSILQTASNPYATILGPIETAARRISIMGICNKVAGMIGIFALYSALFSDTELEVQLLKTMAPGPDKEMLLQSLSNNIIFPYIVITGLLILLVIFLKIAKLPEIEEDNENDQREHRSIFSYPYLWLGVFAIFFYVGAEVIAIDYLVRYGDYWEIPMSVSKDFGIYALVALVVGYLMGIVTIPRLISQRVALIIQLSIAILLLIVALNTTGLISIGCIVTLSLAHAIMWPAIWPLSIHNLGKHTKLGSALLVMAIAGGAILPLIFGKLSDLFNMQIAYSILFISYAYIFFFATFGYKIGINKIINPSNNKK